jgi:N-acetyl-alpha-D-muramate 1-phosphate uridylyltransferase
MKAMIFAAGMGKRLGRLTETVPKALVDINGKTVLQIAVEKCSTHGFDDIIINVHHLADLIEKEVDRLRKMGFRISVSDEREKLLETGGGLYKARGFFDINPFLIYNVDIISDFDLSALYRFHLEKRGLAALAVRNRSGNRFYLINDSGLIRGWRNRLTGEEILVGGKEENLSEIAFSSFHIVEPEIFNYMHEGVYTMTTLYLKLAQNKNIFTFREDGGYWFDIGTPENLEDVRKYLRAPNNL